MIWSFKRHPRALLRSLEDDDLDDYKQKENMLLLFYNITWIFLLPVMVMLLVIRIILGKEDIMRIKERFGIASAVRSTKGIIWIHAASVGESRIALTLTKNLHKI